MGKLRSSCAAIRRFECRWVRSEVNYNDWKEGNWKK
jgi:hypothetical protein